MTERNSTRGNFVRYDDLLLAVSEVQVRAVACPDVPTRLATVGKPADLECERFRRAREINDLLAPGTTRNH